MSTNKIPLNKELADRISTLIGNVRRSVIDLASLAAEIRNQYRDESGKKYDSTFEAFWKAFNMDGKFGTRATFTKYASIGDVIHKVQAQFEMYADSLPVTMTALYEISQLTDEELGLCLVNTYRRSEVTADQKKWIKPKTKPKPLIHPHVQAGIISGWRKRWRNPVPPDTDKRKLSVAEVKIHNSLTSFRKDGTHNGSVSLNDLDAIIEALKAALSGFSSDAIRLDLHDEKLKDKYKKEELKAETKAEMKAKEAEDAAKKKPSKTKMIKKKRSVERLKSA